MRNCWVRRVFVGLIFAFPLLIALASPQSARQSSRSVSLGSPIVVVECLLFGGVIFAARERRRLLAAIHDAESRAESRTAAPSPALAGPKVVVRQPASHAWKR